MGLTWRFENVSEEAKIIYALVDLFFTFYYTVMPNFNFSSGVRLETYSTRGW